MAVQLHLQLDHAVHDQKLGVGHVPTMGFVRHPHRSLQLVRLDRDEGQIA